MSMRTILGVLVSALVVAGCAGATGTAAPAASAPPPSTSASVSPSPSQATASTPAPEATPSPSGAFGGIVHYKIDGGPATTTVDAIADTASVSGTAVTAFREGTHTVRLGCAAQKGDIWVLGGTTEKSTIHGEPAGTWSAVIVRNGSPQEIAVWLSQDPSAASDCEAWLASFDPTGFEPGTFMAVESGALVPPPIPAP
jgi:hypothetical protein